MSPNPKRRRLRTVARPLDSYVVYEGPSALDGAPIVAVLTGLLKASANSKTGAMAQLWILPAGDERPHEAQATGTDASVCGACPLRPLEVARARYAHALGLGPRPPAKACYVRTWQGPRAVYDAYQRGRYGACNLRGALGAVALLGAPVRLGAYGDPSALPNRSNVVQGLCSAASSWTGYTHSWRAKPHQWLRRYCMASCETTLDVLDAERLGWRAFVALDDTETVGRASWLALTHGKPRHGKEREAHTSAVNAKALALWGARTTVGCPAVTHVGQVTCASCKLCNGTGGAKGSNVAHVLISAHN